MKSILRNIANMVNEQLFGSIMGIIALICFIYFALKKDYTDLGNTHLIGKIAQRYGTLPAKILLLLLLLLLIFISGKLVFKT